MAMINHNEAAKGFYDIKESEYQLKETSNISLMKGKSDNEINEKIEGGSNLYQQKISTLEGRKYVCKECGKQATSKGNLIKHRRAVHEGIKYHCEECLHQSTSKQNLE